MGANTREQLAQYASLLNKCGVDSQEADDFLEANKDNTEFVELAPLSRTLKKALTTPTSDCGRNHDCHA